MSDAEPETYYIVRNDAPPRFLGVNEPVVICGEAHSPGTQAIYGRNGKAQAFEECDTLRAEADNPDINVYKMTVEPVDDPRDGEPQ